MKQDDYIMEKITIKELASLRKIEQAAAKMAERLRALREFVGEMELRGEFIGDFNVWTAEDAAVLAEYEAAVGGGK